MPVTTRYLNKAGKIVRSEGEGKEFLADVSTFANASGGDLIFGISENRETNLPEEIVGLDIGKMDEALLQIDSLIRDGLAPRVTGIKFSHRKGGKIIHFG